MMTKRYTTLLAGLLFFALAGTGRAQQALLDYKPRVLLVTAHPDDDALFSATVFKTTHLLGGVVDLALMTNGEGGYRYSTLGNYIYGKRLDKEEVGREWLPGIRKNELMAGGDIVGLRNYFFFDQRDKQYSQDVSIPLGEWNVSYIEQRLRKIIRDGEYDFIFTMMPAPGTHAHHKASAILALRAVKALPADTRPAVLATTILRSRDDTTAFDGLAGYPITDIDRSVAPFAFDRSQKFGHDKQLDYNIIADWVIAEHKTQGTMQQLMGAGMIEQYWYYEINPDAKAPRVRRYFEAVNEVPIYRDPNNIDP